MHELLPGIKLLYLVRDPIDRAVSHYVHNKIKRREERTVDKALYPPDENWYLNVSRYHFQLSRYLEYYSKEDILVIQAERLFGSTEEVMTEIFRFVGVDPHMVQRDEAFTQEYNNTAGKERKTSLAAFLTESPLGRTFKDVGKRLVPQNALEWAKGMMWEDVRKPTPSPEVLTQAREYLKEDAEQLRSLTGKEFRGWSV
jgi:hypothetical protein